MLATFVASYDFHHEQSQTFYLMLMIFSLVFKINTSACNRTAQFFKEDAHDLQRDIIQKHVRSHTFISTITKCLCNQPFLPRGLCLAVNPMMWDATPS